jgi:hypothetical protein
VAFAEAARPALHANSAMTVAVFRMAVSPTTRVRAVVHRLLAAAGIRDDVEP